MTWSDFVGRRVALILIADESDDPPGGILYGVVRAEGAQFLLDRGPGVVPFPLEEEWGHRVRLLSEVSDEWVRDLVGDVDCFVTLSVGPLPEGEATEGLIATGFNWDDFKERLRPGEDH